MKSCHAEQYSDQMHCATCALTWDMNDLQPPQCKEHRMIDFNQDVILNPPPREVTNIGWERPVRITFDGAEGQGRVWVCDDEADEAIAIPGVENARALARLLNAWADAYNPEKLPAEGAPHAKP